MAKARYSSPSPSSNKQAAAAALARRKNKGKALVSSALGGRRANKAARTWTGLFWSFAIRVSLFYLALAAVFNCGSAPLRFDYSTQDERPVCRGLAHGKQALQPLVAPYLHAAQQRIEPYVRPVAPYAHAAYKRAAPIARAAAKESKKAYKKHAVPLQRRTLKRARAYSDPYVRSASARYAASVQPHVDAAAKALRPYRDIYWRDVHPALQRSYALSLDTAARSSSFYLASVHPQLVASYHALQPRLADAYRALLRFWSHHLAPALARAYALYVRPQVDRVLDKVWKGRSHQVSSEAIRQVRQGIHEAKQKSEHAVSSAVGAASTSILSSTAAAAASSVYSTQAASQSAAAAKQAAQAAEEEQKAAVADRKAKAEAEAEAELLRERFEVRSSVCAALDVRAVPRIR